MPARPARVEGGYADSTKSFANGSEAQSALRQTPPTILWWQQLAVLVALGAVFGWIGPFGTFQDLGVLNRFAYWIAAMLVIGMGSHLTAEKIARVEPTASWPAPFQAILGAVLVAIPGTFVVIALEAIFRHVPPLSAFVLIRTYVSVAIVMTAIGIPWAIIRTRRAHDFVPPAAEEVVTAPVAKPTQIDSPFLRRIPPKLGRELLCIATEDHYLRVTTDIGHDLILFRLSDAITELDPALGQQVHRSYWVARQAVAKVERDDSRTWLVLTNGAKVPVSRTYLPELRKTGWLEA